MEDKLFDEQIDSMIDSFVSEQDFKAVETPLKSEKQHQIELKNRLKEDLCYAKLSKQIFNAINLINQYVTEKFDREKAELLMAQIGNSFDQFSVNQEKYTTGTNEDKALLNAKGAEMKPWVLFGLDDNIVIMVYDVVLQCFKKNDIQGAKDILTILLMYAPSVSSFWNAMGYTLQLEHHYEDALNQYAISEEVDPDNVETKFYIARCYLAQHRTNEAKHKIDEIRHAVEHSDDLKTIWSGHIEKLQMDISQN